MLPAPELTAEPTSRWRIVLLLAGVLLLAANLRVPLTSVGPVLSNISTDVGLPANLLGLLNSTPLLAFGLSSVPLATLGRRCGVERVLGFALFALAAGLLLRSAPSVVALFAGTIVLSVAIPAGNVLLPSVVKHHFPTEITLITGIYAATMSGVAAIGSGVAAPIAAAFAGGWRLALGCWVVLTVLAIALWIPQWRSGAVQAAGIGAATARTPWRSALAWQVTLFMGLQSLGFYVCIGWLPSFLTSAGYTAVHSGFLLFYYQAVSLIAYVVGPLLLRKMRSQRAFAALASVSCATGYVGLLVAPSAALVWLTLAGLGAGACLVTALSFFSLRAANPAGAAALSGMAQSIGYLIAAAGPIAFGAIRSAADSWIPALIALTACALVQTVIALYAGRAKTI
ncbi:MFS transporter [Fodinicola feengrottensis]|uniref:MFS transporter n=1 Tax=Fodinicola feengrottensis TaxID=435914 RepID=A0ABN2HCD9_9ACTN